MALSSRFAPRLLAGVGTAALVAAVGLFASSRPAHTAGGPIAVNVANSSLNVTDTAVRQPFQDTAFFRSVSDPPTQDGSASFHNTVTFSVPAGKRLVLQGVSVTGFAYRAGSQPNATLTTTAGGVGATQSLGYFEPSTTRAFDLPFRPVTVYADPGTTVTLELFGTSETFPKDIPVTPNTPFQDIGPQGSVSGYLVDVP